MARFVVEKTSEERGGWGVFDQQQRVHGEAASFLAALKRDDRAPNTIRAYALGVAHFLSWLDERGIASGGVTRAVVGEYVQDFRFGRKGGSVRVSPSYVGKVNPRTRKPHASAERQPRTVNHRLTVIGRFFAHLIARDTERGEGRWLGRPNPVPERRRAGPRQAGMIGRDAPRRGRRDEMRLREPRRLPRAIDPALAEELIAASRSWRDRALLTLLWRTGQRVGDWDDGDGHGVLGMRLSDFQRAKGMIVVRLKGARDEHRVPVTDDFWPLFQRYLLVERGDWPGCDAAWLGQRRGRGRPLRYPAFEAALRASGRRIGANVNAHMFRHAVAQAVVESSGPEVAQALLGHRQIGTTIDAYTRVDSGRLVEGVIHAKSLFDLDGRDAATVAPASTQSSAIGPGGRYAFDYDAVTIAELERIASDSA